MCIYSPMPHTLSYCALIGKCALIRSNTVAKMKRILSILALLSLHSNPYDTLIKENIIFDISDNFCNTHKERTVLLRGNDKCFND